MDCNYPAELLSVFRPLQIAASNGGRHNVARFFSPYILVKGIARDSEA